MELVKTLLLFTFLSLSISCENEPYDLLNIGKIDVDSELFDSLKKISLSDDENKDPVCVTFVYPFNVYLYDDNSEIIGRKIIGNNLQFIEALGSAEQEEGAIGLSYPITSILEDGSTFSIQNNEELKSAIEACIESEIITYCNGLLEEKNCVWKIASRTDNQRYDTSLFDFYNDGTGVFYHKGNAYRTSWVSLFIEGELHINIHLEGNSKTAQDWNFDWKAIILDENTIEIYSQDQKYMIKKECNVENSCDYVEFKECAQEGSENITEFVLDNYKSCITSFHENDINPDLLSLSFYETSQDAKEKINKLDSSSYQNNTNPQLVFVSIENTNTNESYITRIVLFVEACDKSDEL